MALPAGTVTLLFTDIEGSTRLLQTLGDQYSDVLSEHHRLLQEAIDSRGGQRVDTQGDSFFVAFRTPMDAVLGAISAQKAFAGHPWPQGAEVCVRMGLHTGEPILTGARYIGLDVHRAARIAAAGHGSQVLLSRATAELVKPILPRGVSLRDMGRHRLKDLEVPEHIFQLDVAGLRADFPPLKSLDNRPSNLPVQLTAVIGREQEVTELRDLLRREEVRLVTLTGPGGIGKTRLGQEVAAALLDDFPDGVYFVPLAPVSDPSLLPSAIAASLGLRSADHLPAHLRDRQALLLLDNFEHLLPGAPVLTEVLTTCARVKLLVTSRALLRVSGERNFPVPPLPLPDARQLPTAEGLIGNAAVRLFVERAAAASREFRLTGDNASAVAEVCSRLEGLPLAIELAAARTRVLDPAALLTRLERRLRVLTGGARDLPERQQTLRAAISWSYDLLGPDERTLFRRLAVFRGPFSVEAVDAVCNAEGELGDALDGVSALLDNSLLQQRSSSPSTSRLLMLESIREFAWEKLEDAAEMATIRDAHLRYVLVLIEDMTPRMTTADMPRAVTQFLAELDNVRAALDWAALRKPEAANRLRQALSSFHRQRGYLVPW